MALQKNQALQGVILGMALAGLYVLSRLNYLLFHSLVELLVVLTGFAMFLFATATPSCPRNLVVCKLGWLYLVVAAVDVLHTPASKGMGVFPRYTANLPTQLWILGRFLEATGLGAIVLGVRRVAIRSQTMGILGIAVGSVILIFTGYFPDCFVEGSGLTPFKIASEYSLIGFFLLLLWRIWKAPDPELFSFRKPLLWAFFWSMLAEFSFTLYTDVYGFSNMLGHLFRFFSYVVLLRGILIESVQKPFEVLLTEVRQEKEQLEEVTKRDPLTGLFNRHFFNSWIREHVQNYSALGLSSSLVFLDVDGLKAINDTQGHLVGDEVLSFLGETLRKHLRKDAFPFRYGGDEFVIVFPKITPQEAQKSHRENTTDYRHSK
ncbi:MAG: sensor domain-containing diguanylate cyclase [Candidatus Caldatribacteriaceae bacterium]